MEEIKICTILSDARNHHHTVSELECPQSCCSSPPSIHPFLRPLFLLYLQSTFPHESQLLVYSIWTLMYLTRMPRQRRDSELRLTKQSLLPSELQSRHTTTTIGREILTAPRRRWLASSSITRCGSPYGPLVKSCMRFTPQTFSSSFQGMDSQQCILPPNI